MIPKIVHYCWYGGADIPPLLKTCLDSWKKHLPDYQIICWSEENTNFDHPWLIKAKSDKKYAFIADFVRFRALYEYGGIYLDTDMLLLRSLDIFLQHTFFMGFEDDVHVNMALVGAEKGHPLLLEILKKYENSPQLNDFKVITSMVTPLVKNYFGTLDTKIVQQKDGVALYPFDYFYPVPYDVNAKLEQISDYLTENSHSAHLWYKSWYDEFSYFSIQEYKKGFKLLGERLSKNPFQPLSYYKFLGYSLLVNFKKSLFSKK